MSKIRRVEEEQIMKAGKIIGTNYAVWYKDENGARTARRDYREGQYKAIPMTVLNFILDESNEAVTRYQEFDGCLYKRTMYKPTEQEAPAEIEQATETTTPAALQLETLAAKLDRMTAAEIARAWAALTSPAYDGEAGAVDAATDDAIYNALQTIDPAAYWKWQNMPTPIDSAYSDSPERHAHMMEIEAEDVQNLFKAYGVTA